MHLCQHRSMAKRKPKRTESTPGRKPKPPEKRVAHHIGAGVTAEEWPQVERVTKEKGVSRSTIIRAAFGLPPAEM
jgi:hypothetical protein